MPDFIEAVVSATGEKQIIPGHWLEHPVLSRGFRQTARATKASREAKGTAEAKPAQNTKEN